jgi:predicted nuclease with TOPRIM domain
MNTSYQESELRAALTAFETSLHTPIVSGELAEWTKQVEKSWVNVVAQVRHCSEQLHPRQYQQIAKEDPELLPRIDQLKAEDEAINQEQESLDKVIVRLAEHLPKLEPDEEKARKHIDQMVSDGITFVGRVRKHDVAVQTWFGEAFNRDRGVAG